LKYGTDIWSVARWNVTSTAMPMVTSLGSHSTMLVNMRTPSSSSTNASTYGPVSNPGVRFWLVTVKVQTLPLPDAGVQRMSFDQQLAQMPRGYHWYSLQLSHRWISRVPCRHMSQKVLVSPDTVGRGLFQVVMI